MVRLQFGLTLVEACIYLKYMDFNNLARSML